MPHWAIPIIVVSAILIVSLIVWLTTRKMQKNDMKDRIETRKENEEIRERLEDVEYTTYYEYNKELDEFNNKHPEIKDRRKLKLMEKKIKEKQGE